MGCAYIDSLVVKCIFVWSVTIFRATDGSSITWYEPPPSETVTDPAITSTTHKNLTKGFLNEKMSCSFNLTSDMSLVAVSFELGLSTLAGYLQSQSSVNSLDSRFNATWVPTKLTLIVFNVTGDNKGEYLCRVQFFSGGLKSWLRKIVVDVLVHLLCCVRFYLIIIYILDYLESRLSGLFTNVPASPVQPQITNISGKIVTEGGIVTLKCLAEGNPSPSITWIRLLDNSTVTMPLANIRRQDAGNYKCIADNGVGSSDTGVTFIDVQYPVEATGSGGNTTVLEGGAKNFTCPVDGNPEPNIKWYKGVELSGDPISNEKQLEARETGCYTCVARNSLSPSSVSITQCLIVNTSRELPTTITYSTNAPISEGPPWTVIGFVVGAAVILVIAAGAVTWWMRKKKCNEDAKHGDLRYEEVDHLDTGDNLARKASGEDQ